jgi:nucleoside-diphosphate kinase
MPAIEIRRSFAMERTLIILKPDSLQRGLVGKIVTRFEEKGLQIVGLKMVLITEDLAAQHYAPHKGKPFYEGLVRFMTSSPVIVMCLQGNGAIDICRKMMGATFGFKAEAGTIRGDYGVSSSFNLIHGSDSAESAKTELALWFKHEELHTYDLANRVWTYDYSKGKPE